MRVVTAFCLACVCAELLVQLVEAGWARRCIKVVAGLYILTVLLRAISALPARTAQWLQPVQASASIEGVETTILTEAAKRLNEMLAEECEAQTGIPVRWKRNWNRRRTHPRSSRDPVDAAGQPGTGTDTACAASAKRT